MSSEPGNHRSSTALPRVRGASSDALFRIRGVTRSYSIGDGIVQALRGVDLDIQSGEMLVLLGASGSGKSTLLNILGGLDAASSGSVRYGELELGQASDSELTEFRREHVGFVFQFYNLIPSLTTRENVAIVTEIARRPMTPDAALELAGGEQQRVAIARAIAKQPAVLLCDEPTGALDSVTGIKVLQALEHVNRELGTTTVIITHNAAIAAMADRVIRLSDGRITETRSNPARTPAAELSW